MKKNEVKKPVKSEEVKTQSISSDMLWVEVDDPNSLQVGDQIRIYLYCDQTKKQTAKYGFYREIIVKEGYYKENNIKRIVIGPKHSGYEVTYVWISRNKVEVLKKKSEETPKKVETPLNPSNPSEEGEWVETKFEDVKDGDRIYVECKAGAIYLKEKNYTAKKFKKDELSIMIPSGLRSLHGKKDMFKKIEVFKPSKPSKPSESVVNKTEGITVTIPSEILEDVTMTIASKMTWWAAKLHDKIIKPSDFLTVESCQKELDLHFEEIKRLRVFSDFYDQLMNKKGNKA